MGRAGCTSRGPGRRGGYGFELAAVLWRALQFSPRIQSPNGTLATVRRTIAKEGSMREWLVSFAVFSLLSAGSVPAQTVDPNLVQSVRDSKAHASPDDGADTVFQAPAGTDMVWIEKAEKNGFYRVIRRDVGPQGWIAKDDVKLTHAARSSDEKVCAESLQTCPMRGCAQPDTAEARDNTIKRTRPPEGPARRLSFDDIMALQQQADQHIGQGPDDLSKPQRQKLN